MLILTRRTDEIIRIGEEIQIIVKKIRGNQIAIGIVAPKTTLVLREELKYLPPPTPKEPREETVIKVKRKRINLSQDNQGEVS